MVEYLSNDFEIAISSRSRDAETIAKSGGVLTSLEETCDCDIVIPSVPISSFEATIKKIAPLVDGNLVLDVCSVKEYPAKVMQERLSEATGILATHPMFGPDSANDTLAGQKIVLYGVRIEGALYDCIKQYLTQLGLTVIEVTPEEHDRQIARSQVLTHFIGRGLSVYDANPVAIDTEGYKRLLKILDVVENDTSELFHDLNTYNRFAAEARAEFLQALQDIDRELR
ncbi:MAG: prephenate dehydrogenase/arogenate dehydrogenase family protein [Candidatus Marinimicrobia bacterium]|nr:prephenate dehydrogenase/arogenate dehydrogenase family protein [Candidatus Neomarinimicrobiota bacterium]MCF7829493.1 prephenate dehydrogenase/arogenate dehydrogenase family protein [Candidatus Neomarinimicrobiota bacterium]MCF7880109.1 prephenate dehydrogenase/arogenate dehydrogenase family protein [Candidatus Neomarinimicrobiota bacterium]